MSSNYNKSNNAAPAVEGASPSQDPPVSGLVIVRENQQVNQQQQQQQQQPQQVNQDDYPTNQGEEEEDESDMILKIVEKRIRDSYQTASASASAASNGSGSNASSGCSSRSRSRSRSSSPSSSSCSREDRRNLSTKSSSSQKDPFDDMAIQKLVEARIRNDCSAAKATDGKAKIERERQGDQEEQDVFVGALAVTGAGDDYWTQEQQMAKQEKLGTSSASTNKKGLQSSCKIMQNIDEAEALEDAPLPLPPTRLKRGGGRGPAQELLVGNYASLLPGAYRGTPGAELVRTDDIRLSLVGRESSDTDITKNHKDSITYGSVTYDNYGTDIASQVTQALQADGINLEQLLMDDDENENENENNFNNDSSAGNEGQPYTLSPEELLEQGCQSRAFSSAALTTAASESLSIALPVPDNENDDNNPTKRLPLPVAEEYNEQSNPSHGDKNTHRQGRRQWWGMAGIVSCLVLVCAVGVTLLLVFLLPDNNNNTETASSSQPPSTAANTTNNNSNNTNELSLKEFVKSLLPAGTVREINLAELPTDNPQAQALDWLLNDPHIRTYTPDRIQQRFALATFYYSTNGPEWNNSTNWLDYEQHECAGFTRSYFEDVELWMASAAAHTFELMYHDINHPCQHNTTGGAFQHLWLYRNNLVGTLPWTELAMLTSLKSMALFENTELKITLTSELGLLTNLEAVEINSLGVDGTIPTEIGLLTNFKAILASNNAISGTVPSEYGLLRNLVYSILSENSITGSLPGSALTTMSSLEWLYFHSNQLTGTLGPDLLGPKMTKLKFLNMYGNLISGSLPTTIGYLTNMDLMALSDNLLSGELPTELGRLTNIEQGLALQRNDFEGSIPTELGGLTGITGTITGSGTYGLGLGGNQLSGRLPSELGRLSLLARVFVEDNDLTGPFPSELANMMALETFRGENNAFSGQLPNEIAMLATSNGGVLTEWNVSGNDGLLTGTLPDSLCSAFVFECFILANTTTITQAASSLCGCDCACISD